MGGTTDTPDQSETDRIRVSGAAFRWRSAATFTPMSQFEQCLQEDWMRCLADGKPLAILRAEIDGADAIEACVGSATAREIFESVAEQVRAYCLRRRDRVFAVDEHKFIALLPATHAEGTRHVAARIASTVRRSVRESGHAAAGDMLKVAVGAAVCVPDEETVPQSLVELAAEALGKSHVRRTPCVLGPGGPVLPGARREVVWMRSVRGSGAKAASGDQDRREA